MRQLKTILILILFSVSAFSQEAEDSPYNYGFAWSIHTGPFLPNQINNVTEIQPSWGLRFTFPKNFGKASTDWGVTNSHAKGVDYFNYYISAKTEVPFQDLITVVYLGLDGHSYRTGLNNYTNDFGGHFGMGLITHLGGNTYWRMDMKFNVNPGTSLYLGFGFEFRSPPSKEEETPEEAPK